MHSARSGNQTMQEHKSGDGNVTESLQLGTETHLILPYLPRRPWDMPYIPSRRLYGLFYATIPLIERTEVLRSLASPIFDGETCLEVHPRNSGRLHWVYCDKRMVAHSGFVLSIKATRTIDCSRSLRRLPKSNNIQVFAQFWDALRP